MSGSPSLNTFEGLHFHVACGLGGGARGFNRAVARLKELSLRWRCIGGVDVDPAGLADFARLTGVRGTLLDLFSREQYVAWHGREPPPDWREATPEDFHRAAGHERPNLVFTSCPCKGNSGLLAESVAATGKYQALNALALRAMWLGLEAWADDPVEFYLFENVPRIATRSRALLDQINSLFSHFGYAFAETRHDCGELGGLAQTRKRHLSVFRHRVKVPPFLYEPPKRPLRGVGEVLERLPLPGDVEAGGPMHRVPALQWKTWVRLAFVPAGKDWRALNALAVEGGVLRDYGIARGDAVPPLAGELSPQGREGARGGASAPGAAPFPAFGRTSPSDFVSGGRVGAVVDPRAACSREGSGHLGVRGWTDHAGTVTGNGRPGSGPHSVSDPRVQGGPRFSTIFRVVAFADPSPVVTGANAGTCSTVADPRSTQGPNAHQSKFRVTAYDERANCVTGSDRVGSGAQCVADPRHPGLWGEGQLGVNGWGEHAGLITGARSPLQGRYSVADPRPAGLNAEARAVYATGGHYGVVAWDGHSRAVPGFAKNNNGPWSVADPRLEPVHDMHEFVLPAADARLVCVIRALDGTWHRPFTTLELAALQSLFDPDDAREQAFGLDGKSDSAWRERIGNAVPSDAAQAIAEVMGRTLLLAWTGQAAALAAEPVWVQPLAIALSVDVGEGA